MNERPPVDPRPYDRATAIINLVAIVVISMAIFAAVMGIALAIDWAMTTLQGAVCK